VLCQLILGFSWFRVRAGEKTGFDTHNTQKERERKKKESSLTPLSGAECQRKKISVEWK